MCPSAAMVAAVHCLPRSVIRHAAIDDDNCHCSRSKVTPIAQMKPESPRSSFPSTGGWKSRAHVPLRDAPVTMASNDSPILPDRISAAADLRTRRSTFVASSSRVVQRPANSVSSRMVYGSGAPAIAAFSRRCVSRSGKRRFGAVECV